MNIEDTHNCIDELIIAYLSGRANQRELDVLKQWTDASAENKKYVQDRQEVWMATFSPDSSGRFDNNKAYQRFIVRIGGTTKTPQGTKKSYKYPLWYGAAIIALLISVSSVSYWFGGEKLKQRFTDIIIEAPLGSTSKIYLPDSTLVWLNAGSKITYSQGFGVNERKVSLSGEGYFEVAKNEKLTFFVITDELTVSVLGTKFNFSNYSNNEETIVSLVEGKILATNNIIRDNKAKLFPNQRISLNKRTGEMRILKAEAKRSMEWTNGNLFFDEEVLPDIVKELERNYDVTITLTSDSIRTLRFYGSFIKRNCRIEDILDMLASTQKVKYRVEGKRIELSAR